MPRIGRNDPCPCGSGKKYKKCCMEKDEASGIARISGAEAPMTPRRFIEEQLGWPNEAGKRVAVELADMTAGHYPADEILMGITLWHSYLEDTAPQIKKPAVYAAVLEYILGQLFGHTVAQTKLAAKYGVSAGSISNRVGSLTAYMETRGDFEAAPVGPKPAAISRIGVERELGTLSKLLEEQEFDSLADAQAFLDKQLRAGSGSAPARRGPRSDKSRAEELVYAAWAESGAARRTKLAQEALELDPDCADAYTILAQQARSPREAAYLYKQGMQAGERTLGKAFFEENTGYFWGMIESRPYMRAKIGYGEALVLMGSAEEGIRQFEEMLELNPNDNQSVRELLLLALLELDRWSEAAALIERYDEDGSAAFEYNRVLVEYGLNGSSPRLSALLKAAVKQNPHVPGYLTGRKSLPSREPDYIGFGDDSEAIAYAAIHRHLWQSRPALLRLLNAAK